MSVLTYFWNIAEDLAVESWMRKLEPLQNKHTSLHFDGVRVDRDIAQPDVEAFLHKLQRHDFQGHGPGCPYSCKTALHFPCLVAAEGEKETGRVS